MTPANELRLRAEVRYALGIAATTMANVSHGAMWLLWLVVAVVWLISAFRLDLRARRVERRTSPRKAHR